MIYGARYSDTPDRGWYYVPWWRVVILEDGRRARRQRVFRVFPPRVPVVSETRPGRGAMPGRRRRCRQHHLSGVAARKQRIECLAGLGQRKGFGDEGLELTLAPPSQELGEVAAHPLRVTLGLRAPDDADQRDVLDQDQIGGHCLDAARGKTDDQHPGLPIDRAQRLVERVAADRVVDDVGALAAGQLAHPVADAFAAIVVI